MRTLATALLLLAAAGCAPEAPPAPTEAPLPPAYRGEAIGFAAPKEWTREEPGNRLRVAQYRVPDRAGAAEPARFILSTARIWSEDLMQENLRRWAGQMGAEPAVETFRGRLAVTLVDLSGDYASDFEPEPIPAARMLVAVVEGEDGRPWFFKLVGPHATVTGWRDAFVEMLKSAGE